MSREHPFAPHRALLLGIVAVLALVVLLALFGPRWYRRLYHPLRYEPLIQASADRNHLDPYLVAAVVNSESGFRPETVSRKGAVGLMQVMPSTADALVKSKRIDLPTDDSALKDPKTNLAFGTLYLRQLVSRYGDIQLALAAYNAGAGNVDDWLSSAEDTSSDTMELIRFPQTRAFVRRVLRERRGYSELYPDAFDGGR